MDDQICERCGSFFVEPKFVNDEVLANSCEPLLGHCAPCIEHLGYTEWPIPFVGGEFSWSEFYTWFFSMFSSVRFIIRFVLIGFATAGFAIFLGFMTVFAGSVVEDQSAGNMVVEFLASGFLALAMIALVIEGLIVLYRMIGLEILNHDAQTFSTDSMESQATGRAAIYLLLVGAGVVIAGLMMAIESMKFTAAGDYLAITASIVIAIIVHWFVLGLLFPRIALSESLTVSGAFSDSVRMLREQPWFLISTSLIVIPACIASAVLCCIPFILTLPFVLYLHTAIYLAFARMEPGSQLKAYQSCLERLDYCDAVARETAAREQSEGPRPMKS